jgi:hypothetical protein
MVVNETRTKKRSKRRKVGRFDGNCACAIASKVQHDSGFSCMFTFFFFLLHFIFLPQRIPYSLRPLSTFRSDGRVHGLHHAGLTASPQKKSSYFQFFLQAAHQIFWGINYSWPAFTSAGTFGCQCEGPFRQINQWCYCQVMLSETYSRHE